MFSLSIHVPFGEREKHTATSKDKRERRTREAREKRTSRDDCEIPVDRSMSNFAYYKFTTR